jgi:hypothetical protein
MKDKCFMEKNERRALFSQFLIEEDWDFDGASEWMSDHATKKPVSTIILFGTVLPKQRKAIALGQELASMQAGNGQYVHAMEILESIWRYRTQHGDMPADALKLGLQLAAMQEQNGRPEDAMEILEAIWRKRTQHGDMPADALKPGLQLAAMQEKNGRPEDAMEILRLLHSHKSQPLANYTLPVL